MKVTSVEQLEEWVGKDLGVGQWLTMTQERINAFADATGDHQWIHTDPERCRAEGRRTTIAHGYLTLSLITLLREGMDGVEIAIDAKMGINYGSDRLRFINPVYEGDKIRLKTSLTALDKVGENVWQVKYKHVVEIDGEDKPALITEALNRIYF
ncbi:MaoC family dehydratase [Paraburkholderia aspalathi]|uniref:MaoC family dehydratase n=1 Tax=Paraburkholderia aspalathi TaxID=1324617 RepID=UPI001BA94322|nr:MaoC family dehydratase [Paraburkholderia aspalathi]